MDTSQFTAKPKSAVECVVQCTTCLTCGVCFNGKASGGWSALRIMFYNRRDDDLVHSQRDNIEAEKQLPSKINTSLHIAQLLSLAQVPTVHYSA